MPKPYEIVIVCKDLPEVKELLENFQEENRKLREALGSIYEEWENYIDADLGVLADDFLVKSAEIAKEALKEGARKDE